MPGTIAAAGGVLWRPRASGGVEVAVVHRPRYDDWSLPKGKLSAGEPAVLGALREVQEETGFSAVLGRTLGTSRYDVLQDGRLLPKTVRWWAMRATDGRFEPGDEVDALRWETPDDAAALVTAGRDEMPLQLLARAGLDTTTVLLVRHARAGDRASWTGDDLQRPLDERGHLQADRLCAVLAAYAPARVLSAPALRCVQTVAPYAEQAGLRVEVEPSYGEQAEDDEPALSLLRALGRSGAASVVCSQGGVVPALVTALAGADGLTLDRVRARKGSLWALTFRAGVLVDADHLPPLA